MGDMEKAAISKSLQSHMKSRSGTRPYRASTLMEKNTATMPAPWSEKEPTETEPAGDFDKGVAGALGGEEFEEKEAAKSCKFCDQPATKTFLRQPVGYPICNSPECRKKAEAAADGVSADGHVIIKKEAAAKWRELKRLGELAPSDVVSLRKAKLLDYAREVAGLEKGTRAMAREMGVKTREYPAIDVTKIGPDRFLNFVRSLGPKKTRQFATAQEVGAGAADPTTKQIHLWPGLSPLGKGDSARAHGEAIRAVLRRHEIDEMRSMRRLGVLGKPVEVAEASLPRRFHTHAHPEVMARQQGNVAMLHPKVQQAKLHDEAQALEDIGMVLGREGDVLKTGVAPKEMGTLRKLYDPIVRGEVDQISALAAHFAKSAADLRAYVTGPTGAGKTTFAHRTFPHDTHTLLHIDNYKDSSDLSKVDWGRLKQDIAKAKGPVAVEGMDVNPAIARKAVQKILLDPGRETALKRRIARGKHRRGADDRSVPEFNKLWEEYVSKSLPQMQRLGFKKQAAEINFPVGEHSALKKRLAAGKPTFTTRISAEKGKHNVGQRFDTPWGDRVEVMKVQTGSSLDDHPFRDELTPAQQRLISGKPFDLVQLKKVAEVAPGIPSRLIRRVPVVKPQDENQEWDASMSLHPARRRGNHIDLRLVDPQGRAHSWALPKDLPDPGKSTYAVQQPTHTGEYALQKKPFEIPKGYGETRQGEKVQPISVSKVEVVEAGEKRISFLRHLGRQTEEFVLRRIQTPTGDGKKLWAFHNATKNRGTAEGRRLPDYKPKYREVEPERIDVEDGNKVLTAKIDGAHGIMQLHGKDRFARLYSYRRPVSGVTGVIEHTHKMPGFHTRTSPNDLKGTVVRAEMWFSDASGKAIPSQKIGGMLNASAIKSRRMQQEAGVKPRITVVDVIRSGGKNMEKAPYAEKLKVMERVAKDVPGVELPPMARTAEEKRRLISDVKAGRLPETKEGVVEHDLWERGAAFVKAVFKPVQDVVVRGVFKKPAGEARGHAGGIEYSYDPDGPVVGRVGTGFDHRTRKDMLANPESYVGRVAKVRSMSAYENRADPSQLGALRAPSFKGWHIDKTDPALMKEAASDDFHRIYSMTPKEREDVLSQVTNKFRASTKGMTPEGVVRDVVKSRPTGRAVLQAAHQLEQLGIEFPKIAGKAKWLAVPAGAGIGAGVGALSDRKNRLRGIAIGAGSGAAAGAAGAAGIPRALKALRGAKKPPVPSAASPHPLQGNVDGLKSSVGRGNLDEALAQFRTILNADPADTSGAGRYAIKKIVDRFPQMSGKAGAPPPVTAPPGASSDDLLRAASKMRSHIVRPGGMTDTALENLRNTMGRVEVGAQYPKMKLSAKKDYGPGGKWIYDRAHGMMGDMKDRYGEKEGERVAYATATQQAHAVRKSPKKFRTPEGVKAARLKHSAVRQPPKALKKTAAWPETMTREQAVAAAEMAKQASTPLDVTWRQ